MSGYERHVEVTSVTCSRNSDGELQSAKASVEYFEMKEPEGGGEPDFQNGESIRFKWKPDSHGELLLHGWKDASDHSGWVSPAVLRCLPAATAAVQNIPGVEVVEDVHDAIKAEIDIGIDAYLDSE